MKTTVIYIVAVILSLFYVQSTTAQDTIAVFEDPGTTTDMIATQDGNLILVTTNYVKKVTTEGEELWSFESDVWIYTFKIVERQNGNFLVFLLYDEANLCELDNNTGELLNECFITHPVYTGDSYLQDFVEMPNRSICAIWQHLSSNTPSHIVKIHDDLSDYEFITQSDSFLNNIASVNETQVMCTSFNTGNVLTETGTKVYDISGELLSNNPYSDKFLSECLTRLDNSRFISLNENHSTGMANLLFCNDLGEVLQTVAINRGIGEGDMAINEEDYLTYSAIQQTDKKSDVTPKVFGPSIWSVNFEGEVVDSLFFTGDTDGVGICHYGDYIYYCHTQLGKQYLIRIPKSVLASIKEPKMLVANTYPNPAQDEVYFEWESQKLEHGTVEIIDLQGKLVASIPIVNTSVAWHCANYANGVYLYRIIERGATVGSGKIVVRH